MKKVSLQASRNIANESLDLVSSGSEGQIVGAATLKAREPNSN